MFFRCGMLLKKGVWVFVCEFVRIADISEG